MDKKEAGMALIEMCRSAKQSRAVVIIGEYHDFQMGVYFNSFFSKYIVNLKGYITHEVEIEVDPLGKLQRLNIVLKGMDRKIEVMKPFAHKHKLTKNEKIGGMKCFDKYG